MKKRKKIYSVLLILVLAVLILFPAYCRRSRHKGLHFISADRQSGQQQVGLVVVTHGWIHKGNWWPKDMAEAIDKNVDANDWLIGYFDWGKGSATIDPVDAVTYARDMAGSALAGQILKLDMDFEHIHLIGHSCGSWVVSEAAKILAPQMGSDIHLTFLDAYVPKDWQQEQLGDINCLADVNCWADHYWTEDMTRQVTGVDLANAHNINLTRIDQLIKDHNFPWKWYMATITGSYPKWKFLDNDKLVTDVNGLEYGFAMSRECGDPNAWPRSLQLETGNCDLKVMPKEKM